MTRPFTRIASAVFWVAVVTTLGLGCSRYDMEEPIEMGPFTFEVTGVSERVTHQYARPTKQITVQLGLVSNESRRDLLHFLEGTEKGFDGIVWPYYKLEDSHGHRFDNRGQASSSGRNISFDLWRRPTGFQLGGRRRVNKDALDDWSDDHVNMAAEDCWLVITNPEIRRGQPGAASIRLQ